MSLAVKLNFDILKEAHFVKSELDYMYRLMDK